MRIYHSFSKIKNSILTLHFKFISHLGNRSQPAQYESQSVANKADYYGCVLQLVVSESLQSLLEAFLNYINLLKKKPALLKDIGKH